MVFGTNASRLRITDLYCPARTAARGDQLRPQVPPCGAHWPLHLRSLILRSGSDTFAAQISRNSERLRLSNRQLKHCKSRGRELPRSKFANYRSRLVVGGSRSASSRTWRQLSSAMPVSVSARRKEQLSTLVLRTRVENPAEPRYSSANSFVSCRENRMLSCKVTHSAPHPILAITEAKTSTRFNAAPQDS